MPRNEKLVIKFNSIERDVICCNVVSFTAPLKSETPAAPGSVDAYPRIFPTAKTAVVMSCILTSPLPRRFIYLFAFCARSRRVSFLFSSLFFFSFFFLAHKTMHTLRDNAASLLPLSSMLVERTRRKVPLPDEIWETSRTKGINRPDNADNR